MKKQKEKSEFTEGMSKIMKLSFRMNAYDEKYRKKIYPKLTKAQKKKRNYRIINGKEYCNNLVLARNKHFKKEANKILKEIVLEEKK